MYKKMLVPVDLAHVEKLDKALQTARDLATHYKIPICFLGVTPSTPTEVAHSPEEYQRKLDAFADEQASADGVETTTVEYVSHDPARDLYKIRTRAADEQGCDVIVMASHVPGVQEHVFTSNAGYVASHADVSVFVVR
jgi:nucleotide-binding universal stress UspA family protein